MTWEEINKDMQRMAGKIHLMSLENMKMWSREYKKEVGNTLLVSDLLVLIQEQIDKIQEEIDG